MAAPRHCTGNATTACSAYSYRLRPRHLVPLPKPAKSTHPSAHMCACLYLVPRYPCMFESSRPYTARTHMLVRMCGRYATAEAPGSSHRPCLLCLLPLAVVAIRPHCQQHLGPLQQHRVAAAPVERRGRLVRVRHELTKLPRQVCRRAGHAGSEHRPAKALSKRIGT